MVLNVIVNGGLDYLVVMWVLNVMWVLSFSMVVMLFCRFFFFVDLKLILLKRWL